MGILLVTGQKVGVSTDGTTSSTISTPTFPVATTAGNLIVGQSGNDTGGGADGPATGVTDDAPTGGNLYAAQVTSADNGTASQRTDGFYAKNIKAGATVVTASWSTAPAFRQIHAAEFSGADTVSPLDKTNTGTGSGTVSHSNTVLPSTNGQLIWGGEGNGSSSLTVGSGFTLLLTTNNGGTGVLAGTQYQIQSTAASIESSWTHGTSANYADIIMTFKAAAAGSSVGGTKRSPRALPVPKMRGPQVKAWMRRPRPQAAPSSAKIVTLGQALETDIAQPITRLKSLTIGQVVETDTAQPITRVRSRTIGQALETDTAQAIALRAKAKTLGLALETDLAQPVGRQKAKTLGQAVETDLAQPVAHAKVKTLGQALETDLAQPVGRQKAKTLGQALETDTAQTITPVKSSGGHTVIVNQASEVDLAQTLAVKKVKALGQASEADLAQALRRVKSRTLGQASELELAQALSRLKAKGIGQASELDAAQALVRRKARAIAQALEVDLAQAVQLGGARTPGRIAVADFALVGLAIADAPLSGVTAADSEKTRAAVADAALSSIAETSAAVTTVNVSEA